MRVLELNAQQRMRFDQRLLQSMRMCFTRPSLTQPAVVLWSTSDCAKMAACCQCKLCDLDGGNLYCLKCLGTAGRMISLHSCDEQLSNALYPFSEIY